MQLPSASWIVRGAIGVAGIGWGHSRGGADGSSGGQVAKNRAGPWCRRAIARGAHLLRDSVLQSRTPGRTPGRAWPPGSRSPRGQIGESSQLLCWLLNHNSARRTRPAALADAPVWAGHREKAIGKRPSGRGSGQTWQPSPPWGCSEPPQALLDLRHSSFSEDCSRVSRSPLSTSRSISLP